MIQDIIVIDNVVPLEKQEELKHIMFDTLFPWFYIKNLTNSNAKLSDKQYSKAPGFAHVFYNELGKIGNFGEYADCIAYSACEKLELTGLSITRARAFLQLPIVGEMGMTSPHVDTVDKNHMVVLYYIMDSDGETLFFNRKNDPNNPSKPYEFSEEDIVYKMKPRQGSAVVFNGCIYHANMLPQESNRCVINFNLEEDI
jgi:hypothetical protein